MTISATILISVSVCLVGFGALIALQYVLSNLNGKGWGLILPVVSLLVSVCLSVPNYIMSFHGSFSGGAFAASSLLLALYNIPTLVFVLVYVWRRRKIDATRQLNKMNIQDL